MIIQTNDITYYEGSDNILIVIQNDGDNKYHYLPRRKRWVKEHNTKRIGKYLYERMFEHNLRPSMIIVDMSPIHILTNEPRENLMKYGTSKVVNTYSYFYDLINKFAKKHSNGIIFDIHNYRSSSYRSLIQIGTLNGLTFDKSRIQSNYFFENSKNEIFMGGYLLEYIYQNYELLNAVQLSYPKQFCEEVFSEEMYKNSCDLIIESFVDIKWETRLSLPPSPKSKPKSKQIKNRYIVKFLSFMLIFLVIYFIQLI